MARHSKANLQHSQTSSFSFEPSPKVQALVCRWLTSQEAKDIYQQFQKSCIRNCQVLWSGMERAQAQRWADQRNLQTLTTALGPLLDPSHPDCPYHPRPPSGWVRYIHGASVIFAWYISQGDSVIVLSQPPPQRFHPSGKTFYQTIEEPIIEGKMGNRPVKKIIVVHPTVGEKAEDFKYEMWPRDEVSIWTETFGILKIVIHWRAVQGDKPRKSRKSRR
ncbi:hypothetical protein B0J15DRAFT_389816 [Fusarium solani]|uniref:Uncharacterized protein n=1 Tax=Fusarium solani TaxID=169388 RepID=A0A9P9R5Z4_FUSSL|nr:uncharacterized protein B0J15DRAFT_389816 [Fusarium solani]KAH7267981.1 hypothetical protein B0J15DRAFT_389816 [Fusarium solani]